MQLSRRVKALKSDPLTEEGGDFEKKMGHF